MLHLSSRYLIVWLCLFLVAMQEAPPAPDDIDIEKLKQNANELLKKVQMGQLAGEAKRTKLIELSRQTRRFLSRNPDNLDAWLMSASICGELSDEACVDASARAIARLNPQYIQGGLQWAAYYMDRNNPTRAIEVLDELLEGNPTSLMYYNAWLITAKAYEPSLIYARFKELMVDPEAPEEAIAFLTAMQKSDPWAAVDLGGELQAWSPTHPEVLLVAARGLRGTNQFHKARQMIEDMPDEIRQEPHIAYLYSDCLYADHHFEKAYEILSSIDFSDIEGRPGLERRIRFMLPLREQAMNRWPRERELRASQSNSTRNPRIKLMVDGSPVELELFIDESPNTVAAFLARARKGDYDGLPFMRVHTGFRSIIGNMNETVQYTLPAEIGLDNSRDFFSGTVSMYMPNPGDPDSSTTQWCLYHFPAPHLNGTRNVFGRVTNGLETIRAMKEDAVLDSVEILRAPEIEMDPVVINSEGQRVPLSSLGARPTSPSGSTDQPTP